MATHTAVDVVMPQMGVSVSEGTVTKWLKSIGDPVAQDEPLLEISTDKVDTEVPSPAAGVLTEILVQEGETVAVHSRIAVIAPEGSAVAEQGAAPSAAPPEPQAAEDEPEAEPVAQDHETDGQARRTGKAFLSPVVARIAAEHDVDISRIEGSGRAGRVTKKDILAHLESRAAQAAAAAPQPAVQSQPAPPAIVTGVGETAEPMTAMRRGIAEHMRRSLDSSAHVTTGFEIDMSKVVAIRNRLKGEYAERHGAKLTYLAFIARATLDAIANWPWINSELRGDSIVVKHYVNLGIAVALEGGKGLIVPVIRNAEERNLLGIARAIEDLGERARSKRLVPEDVQGGTFTITNPGGFGAIFGTPIINQPQVAILDIGAIVKRAVVVEDEYGNDAVAIRPIMHLGLSYDHRVIDGAYAAQFMRDLKQSLESWDEAAY